MTRRDEIRARCRAASLPPWTGDEIEGYDSSDGATYSHWGCGPAVETAEQAEADGEFIAMAREDIPWQNARLDELAKALRDIKRADSIDRCHLIASEALAALEES